MILGTPAVATEEFHRIIVTGGVTLDEEGVQACAALRRALALREKYFYRKPHRMCALARAFCPHPCVTCVCAAFLQPTGADSPPRTCILVRPAALPPAVGACCECCCCGAAEEASVETPSLDAEVFSPSRRRDVHHKAPVYNPPSPACPTLAPCDDSLRCEGGVFHVYQLRPRWGRRTRAVCVV